MRRESVIKYSIIAVAFIVCGIFYSLNFKEDEISLNSTPLVEENTDLGLQEEQYEQNKETAVESDNINTEIEEKEASSIFVYVCGEVNTPGVYEIENGSRVYEAVEAAGGLSQNAANNYVNLAQVLNDGEMIQIPNKEEALSLLETMDGNDLAPNSLSQSQGKININTAAKDVLTTLPGIGEAKANSIISYREENKGFKSKEELMQIEGIKEGVYNKIKDLIIIN